MLLSFYTTGRILNFTNVKVINVVKRKGVIRCTYSFRGQKFRPTFHHTDRLVTFGFSKPDGSPYQVDVTFGDLC